MATVRERPRSGSAIRHEQVVDNQLNKALQRIRVLDLSTGIFSFLAITLGFSLVMALLDRWLNLPLLARQLALLAYVATVTLFVAVFLVRPYLRKINPYYAARQVERTLPSAKNSVVNWLDLRDEPIPSAILGAVGQRAAHDLAHTDLEQAISGKRATWLGSITGMLLLAQFMALIFWGFPTFTSLWGRTFAPFNNLGITSKTRIDVKTKDVTVPVDHAVTISAGVSGKVPDPNRDDALKLHIRYRQGDPYEEAILLEPESEREWFTTVPVTRVQSGFWYKVTGGDYETEEYHVVVRSLPMITGFDVSLHYRPYLGWVDKTGHNANLRDVAGTQAALVVHTNRAVSKGTLVFVPGDTKISPKQLISTQVKDDPKAMSFVFALETSGVYRIKYTSTDGESSAESPDYTITVIPDNAPKVELVQPGADVSLPAIGTLQLVGSASDDFGITKITLFLKLGEDTDLAEKPYRNGVSFKLGAAGGYPQMLEYKDFIELPKLKTKQGIPVSLTPGMVIEYWLEAEDACDLPEPHKAQSKHYKITIAKPDEDKKKEREDQQNITNQAKKEQQEHENKQDQKLNEEKQKLEQNNQQEQEKTKADQEKKNQEKNQDKGDGETDNSKEGNPGKKEDGNQAKENKGQEQSDKKEPNKKDGQKGDSKDPNKAKESDQGDDSKGDDQNPNDAKQPNKNKKNQGDKDKAADQSKANDQKDKSDDSNKQNNQGGNDTADNRKDSNDKANKIDNNNAPGNRNVKADDAKENEGNKGQEGDQNKGSGSKGTNSKNQADNLAKQAKDLDKKIEDRERQKGASKGDPANDKAENKGAGQPQQAPEKGDAKEKNPPGNSADNRQQGQPKGERDPSAPEAQNKGDTKEEGKGQQANQKPAESKDKTPGQQSAGESKDVKQDPGQQAAKNADAKDEGKPPQPGKQEANEAQAKDEGKPQPGNPGDKNSGEKTQAKEAGKGQPQEKTADNKPHPDGKEPAASTAKNDRKPDPQSGMGEGKDKKDGKDQNVAQEKKPDGAKPGDDNKAGEAKAEGKKDQGAGAKGNATAKAEKPPQEKSENKQNKGGGEPVADKKNPEASKENGSKDAGQDKSAQKDKGESSASAKGEQPNQGEKGEKNKGDGSAKNAKPEDVKDLAKHMQSADADKKEAAERKLKDIAQQAKDEQARKDAEKALKEGKKDGEKSEIANNKTPPMNDGQPMDKGSDNTGEPKKGDGQKSQEASQAKNNSEGNKSEGESKNQGRTAKGNEKDPMNPSKDSSKNEDDTADAKARNHESKDGGTATGGPSKGDPTRSAPSTNREVQPGSEADPEFQKKANDLQLRKMRDALDKKLLDGSMTEEEKAAYKDWLKKYEEFKRSEPDDLGDPDMKAPNPDAKHVNEGVREFQPGKTDKSSNPKYAGNGAAPPEFQGSFLRSTKPPTKPDGK